MNADSPTRLDVSRWARRDHFHFFRDFERPFFNLCTELDVTALVDLMESAGRSFFLAVLYSSLRAANGVREFRLRIRGDDVVEHPVVHAGSTVFREDETFGFGYFDYVPVFDDFERTGRRTLEVVRHTTGLVDDRADRDDLIYCSVIPWVVFTSFAHARRCPATESNPRIVFGRRNEKREGEWWLPISIEVHHALVDGVHVGRFLESFQALLHEPEEALAAR
jgi:chloramphenicol O-acetyltransferase type A